MICAHCYLRYTDGDKCPNCDAEQTLREADTGPVGSA